MFTHRRTRLSSPQNPGTEGRMGGTNTWLSHETSSPTCLPSAASPHLFCVPASRFCSRITDSGCCVDLRESTCLTISLLASQVGTRREAVKPWEALGVHLAHSRPLANTSYAQKLLSPTLLLPVGNRRSLYLDICQTCFSAQNRKSWFLQ